MAFASIGVIANGTNKTSNSSFAITTSAVGEVGNVIVVACAYDNTSTADGDNGELNSVTDSAGNTYTKLVARENAQGAGAAGVGVALWATRVTTELANGGTITIGFASNRTAKAAVAWEFSGGAFATAQTTFQLDDGTLTHTNMSLSSMTSRSYLIVAAHGREQTTQSFTNDADYTASSTYYTSGGTAATNMGVVLQFRIATLTGDTISGSWAATNADLACVSAALYEMSLGPDVELFSMTDSAVANITDGQSISDSFAMTDSDSGMVAEADSVSESFSMTDSATGNTAVSDQSASDSFAMTDSISVSASVADSDLFGMTDSTTGSVSIVGVSSDSFAMTDSDSGGVVASATASDSFAMTDSDSGGVVASATASDSFAMSDSTSGDVSGGTTDGSTADSFSMTDAAFGYISTSVIASDSFSITDEVAGASSVSGLASDSFTMADSASGSIAISAVVSDAAFDLTDYTVASYAGYQGSIHSQSLQYLRDEIIALGLDGLDEGTVRIRKFPWTTDHVYPGLTIHPLREATGEGSAQKFDVGFACGLTLIISTGDGIEEDLERVTEFRQAIRRRFERTTPSVLACVWQLTVENGDVYMPRRYQDHYDVTTMLVRFWSEEPVYQES